MLTKALLEPVNDARVTITDVVHGVEGDSAGDRVTRGTQQSEKQDSPMVAVAAFVASAVAVVAAVLGSDIYHNDDYFSGKYWDFLSINVGCMFKGNGRR